MIPTISFEYDEADNIGQITSRYEDGSTIVTAFKYDERGNVIEATWLETQNNLLGGPGTKIVYDFDNNGNPIEGASYNPEGTLTSRWEAKWNNGNLIKETDYDSDEKLQSTEIHKYDQDGNRIESTSYDSDGNLTSRQTYTYDNGRNAESCSYDAQGSLISQYMTEYLEFDGCDNWIKCVVLAQSSNSDDAVAYEGQWKETRTIVYWDE